MTPACSASSGCDWRSINDRSEGKEQIVYAWYPIAPLAPLCALSVSFHCCCRDISTSYLSPKPHLLPTLLFIHGGRQDHARQAYAERQLLETSIPTQGTLISTTVDTAMTMTPSITPRTPYYLCSRTSSCSHDTAAQPRIDTLYPLAVYCSTEVRG